MVSSKCASNHVTLDFFYALTSPLAHIENGRKLSRMPTLATPTYEINHFTTMKKQTKSILCAALAVLCMITLTTACTASKQTNTDIEQISYHEARNFFLNQGQELAVGQKITNDKDFDKYFGLAAFMGKGGEPTRVDFANEFVLPIVLPETDCETDINAVSLSGNASVINLNYKVKVGEKRDFYIRPIMLLVVDKAYRDAQVVVNQ